MKNVDFTKMYKATEVKLTYVTNVKASHRIKIENAEDAKALGKHPDTTIMDNFI